MKKSGKFLPSLVLALSLSLQPCSSEVVLTDEEAVEMLQEMEKSEEELTKLKDMSDEQAKSYERRLSEVKSDKNKAWVVAGSSSVTSILLGIALIIILL